MSRTSILGSVAVKLGLFSTQFDKDLKKTELQLKRFGSKMNSVGKSLSVGITAPLAALAATSLKAFDTQAKAVAQVEAGLKSTGNAAGFTSTQLQKMASSLQGVSLFGDEQILKDVTAQLLTFTNVTGQQFARTQQAALDLATRMDGDLKGATLQLGKALNDPIKGLSALSESGIQFSDDQRKVIEEMVRTNRIAEAQDVILKELETQFGGSAKAAREAGLGGFQALQMAIGDLLEEIGKHLAPIVNEMADRIRALVERLQGMASTLDREVAMKLIKIAGIVAVGGPLLLGLGAVLSTIAAIGLPALALGAAIAAIAAGIIYVMDNLPAFRVAMINTFSDVASSVIDSIQSMLSGLLAFAAVPGMTAIAQGAGAAIAGLEGLKDSLPMQEDAIEFGTFGRAIESVIMNLLDKIGLFKAELRKTQDEAIKPKAAGGQAGGRTSLLDTFGIGMIELEYQRFVELSDEMLFRAQALGQAFDAVAMSFSNAFVDGLTGVQSAADAFRAFGDAVVDSLKQIAKQLIAMAALRGLAMAFGLPTAGIFTGTDLAQSLFQRGNVSMGRFTPGTGSIMPMNANLFLNGRQLRTQTNFTNNRATQFGF